MIFTQAQHSALKNKKISLTKKIFRQINSLVKMLLSRNFCQKHVRQNCSNFHTAGWSEERNLLQFSVTHFWQKFHENNGFTKEITK